MKNILLYIILLTLASLSCRKTCDKQHCDESIFTEHMIVNHETCTCDCWSQAKKVSINDTVFCLNDYSHITDYLYYMTNPVEVSHDCSSEKLVYLYLIFNDDSPLEDGRRKGNVVIAFAKESSRWHYSLDFSYYVEPKELLFGYSHSEYHSTSWFCEDLGDWKYLFNGVIKLEDDKLIWNMRLFEIGNDDWPNDVNPDEIKELEFVRYRDPN